MQQFTDLYIRLTGRQPIYDIEKITFTSYREGLQKAYLTEVEDYQAYRTNYVRTQHPIYQDIFFKACRDAEKHANRFSSLSSTIELTDYGKQPFVTDIEEDSKQNNTFRTALWTGNNLQVTLMSINVGDDIGLELHSTVDQFLRVEQGKGLVQIGDSKDQLNFEKEVYDDDAIMIPAGKWHNLTNTGQQPLKLYSIYASAEHPFGTVHQTKADAMVAEETHH